MMTFSVSLLALSAVVLLLPGATSDPFRMSPNPQHYQEVNADGSVTPLIRLIEDSWEIYEETMEGYRVESIDGNYKYLEVDATTESLVDSGLLAGRDDPKTAIGKSGKKLEKGTKGSKKKKVAGNLKGFKDSERRRQIESVAELAAGIPEEHQHYGRRTSSIGVRKNLVVPFKFMDQRSRSLPSTSDLNILMNNQGPHPLCPTGSVKDVYLVSSYGKLQLNSFIAPWVVLPGTEGYYANGASGLGPTGRSQEMIRDALNALEAMGFDFRQFDMDRDGYIDAIAFLHSGYSAEWGGNDSYGAYYKNRIWSHKWTLYQLPSAKWTSRKTGVNVYNYHVSPSIWGTSGNNIGRIGVIAHETGHFLGLPDLYDFDGGGNGIGSVGLMANCWGFDNSQYHPPHMSPWSKIQLGWLVPTLIQNSGRYALKRSCDNPDVYIIKHNYPTNEYLLIENRQKCRFDADLAGVGGLAVYHIDEIASYNTEGFTGQNNWPSNGNHYRVALLQADGAYDLERGNNRGDGNDFFHSSGVSGIGPFGTSSAKGSVNAFPNTKAYQGGRIRNTDVSIKQISSSGYVMTFTAILGSSSSSQISSTLQESQFELILQTDNRGYETGWELIRLDAPNGTVVVDHRSSHTYASNEHYMETAVLEVGVYEFVITDLSGNGICCNDGAGSYTIVLDNTTIVASGGSFTAKEVIYFSVGISKSSNKDDDSQWLTTELPDQPNLSIAPTPSNFPPSPPPAVTSMPPATYYGDVVIPVEEPQKQEVKEEEWWEIITYDDFENGLGSFVYESSDNIIGASNYDMIVLEVYAHQGTSSLVLRDNIQSDGKLGKLSSAVQKYNSNVTKYNQLRVKLWYFVLKSPSADHNLLLLEYSSDGGSQWSVAQVFPLSYNSNDGAPQFVEATIFLDRHLIVFSSQARLRFRFETTAGKDNVDDVDLVFIDEIEFSGK